MAGSSAFSRASIAWPAAGGGSPPSVPPSATWSWSLTRSSPVDHLGHRVLHLEAGVDLHEGEAPFRRLVKELHRRRAAVARLENQAPRRLLDFILLRLRQRRAGGLLDHLLVAPLQAAVAHAHRPGAARAVGDRLDLDVAGRRHKMLQENRRVTEGLLGLRPRAARTPGRAGLPPRPGGSRARRRPRWP